MSEDPKGKPPSPFALAPSAYPPPASSRPPPVVVPSAGRASSVPAPPFSSEPSADPAIPLLAPPVLPFEQPSPTSPRRRLATIVLAGGVGLAVVLLALGTWALLPRLRSARPTGSAVVAAPAATPSTTGSADGPASAASAAPPASVAAVAASQPVPMKPFDRHAARTALDALAPTLTDCKIPRGKSGRIKIAFASDGTVLSAKPLPPLAGTSRGACVAGHLKQAKVPPFSGSAPPYVYSFVVPR